MRSYIVVCWLSAFLSGLCGSSLTGPSATQDSNPESDFWRDLKTGLYWTTHDSAKDLTHRAAESYCKSLDIGGFSGWRLPAIDELEQLYDVSSSRKDKKGKEYHISGGIVLIESWSWSGSPSSSMGFWAYHFTGKGRRIPAAAGPFSHVPTLCVHSPR